LDSMGEASRTSSLDSFGMPPQAYPPLFSDSVGKIVGLFG